MEKGKSTDFISFIIALIIVGLLFYFIYIKFIRINKVEPTTYNVNTIIDDADIEKIGKEKYDWLSNQKNVIDDSFVFFKNKSVYQNLIDFQDVLTIAYRLTDSKDRNYNASCIDNTCIYERFDKEILQEQVDKYFSSNLKLIYKEFRPTGNILCTIENDIYTCKKDNAELKNDPLLRIPGYLYSRNYNGRLVVYSTFVSVKRNIDYYHEEEQGIYAGTNLKDKIDDLTFFSSFNDQLNKENYQKIIDKYKDKLPVYKTTFVLENNNYVWEKTEIEK